MSLNSLVKKVADHYITLRSGNPNASFNEAVSEALRCYIVYEGGTAPVDFNARVLKACDIYLTSQSDTSVGGFNQDVVKALRAYLTGENSSFIPYSFNEVLIAAANNFLNHDEGATVALDFTTNRFRAPTTNILSNTADLNSMATAAGTGVTPVVTSGITARDGTPTAQQVVFNIGGGTTTNDWSWLYATETMLAQAYTQWAWMRTTSGTVDIIFDFNTTNTNVVTLTTDWQLFQLTKTATAGARNTRIGLRGGTTTANTATLQISELTLEYGENVTTHVPTSGGGATSSPTSGYVSDFTDISGLTVTRTHTGFTYAYAEKEDGTLVAFAADEPRWTDKGLLVEEARTNLFLRSQELDNATWTKSNGATLTADQAAAPDGSLTADKFSGSGVGTGTSVNQTISVSASTVYTISLFAKAGTLSTVYLRTTDGVGATVNRGFDLSAGITTAGFDGVAPTGSSIQALGAGWYRCTITITTGVGATAVQLRVFSAPSASTITADDFIYVWGGQAEAGSFPTSYIPTTSASATRAADVVSIGGLSVTSPMTLLAAADHPAHDATSQIQVTLAVGTDASNRLVLFRTGGQVLQALSTAAGATAYQQNSANKAGARTLRSGMSHDGTYRSAVDGVANSSGAGVYVTGTVNNLFLGAQQAGATQLNGYLRRVLIYPTAFTDAQLQAYTA